MSEDTPDQSKKFDKRYEDLTAAVFDIMNQLQPIALTKPLTAEEFTLLKDQERVEYAENRARAMENIVSNLNDMGYWAKRAANLIEDARTKIKQRREQGFTE
jgi:hypothetical protein